MSHNCAAVEELMSDSAEELLITANNLEAKLECVEEERAEREAAREVLVLP